MKSLPQGTLPSTFSAQRFTSLRPLALVLLLALVSGWLCDSIAASPRSKRPHKSAGQLRQELSGVKSRIRQTRGEIRETRARERRVVDEMETVEARLLSTETRLEKVEARRKYLKEQERRVRARIDATQKRLEGRRRTLARRVRTNYIRGNTHYIQVLLNSRTMHDYLSRSYYVERIVDSDIELIQGITADLDLLAADRKRLQEQIREQEALQAQLQAVRAEYRQDVQRKRELIQEIREHREEMQEALDLLEQASRDIEAQIRAIQLTPRGRARLMRAWSGSFIKPADGPITSGFGMRLHPILREERMHTGVDIGAGYGAPIRAAAEGEVIVAGYQRGYGYVVVIDHGGGVSTLYGHCSAILVSTGQTVARGQTIARVGSTGLATGPHLHFEVRRNGTPVNPY